MMINDMLLQPPTDALVYDFVSLNNTLLIAGQDGLWQSLDQGESWKSITNEVVQAEDIAALVIKLSPNFEHDGKVIVGISGGILMSNNAGETWSIHPFRNPLPVVTSISFSPNFINDQIVFAGTYEDGMFQSVDGGTTWSAYNFGLFDQHVLCTAISPNFAADKTVCAGTTSGVYISSNSGKLWSDNPSSFDTDAVVSMRFSHAGELYVGTESSGLYMSSDGGGSWRKVQAFDGAINVILFHQTANTETYLIIQHDDVVMISRNGGADWETLVERDVVMVAYERENIIFVDTNGIQSLKI